jgi:glycosyltransferase involved in cell wall biosynthesis
LRRGAVPERVRIALRVLKMRSRFRDVRPEVVYCHSNEIALANMLLKGQLFPDSAFVLHQHGAENPLVRSTYPWARHSALVLLYEQLLRAAHRRCDRIVVIDRVSQAKNESWGLAHRLLYLPNAIDLSRYRPRQASLASVRESWGLAAGDYVFLHAGRLEAIKRQDAIVGAFEQWLAATTTAGMLVVAGEGTLHETLRRRVAESAAADRIRLLGFVPPDRMESLMQSSNCFVLASEAEGVPMVLLESLACGVPFIAPAIGGIPELARDGNGILMPPVPSEQTIAAAMRDATGRVWDPLSIRASALQYGSQAAVGRLEREFALLAAERRHGD